MGGAIVCNSIRTRVFFGGPVLLALLPHMTWQSMLYAVLSLTIVRMLPVWLSLAGTRLSLPGKLFIGWFGPRGLASIVFAVIVMDAGLRGRTLLLPPRHALFC